METDEIAPLDTMEKSTRDAVLVVLTNMERLKYRLHPRTVELLVKYLMPVHRKPMRKDIQGISARLYVSNILSAATDSVQRRGTSPDTKTTMLAAIDSRPFRFSWDEESSGASVSADVNDGPGDEQDSLGDKDSEFDGTLSYTVNALPLDSVALSDQGSRRRVTIAKGGQGTKGPKRRPGRRTAVANPNNRYNQEEYVMSITPDELASFDMMNNLLVRPDSKVASSVMALNGTRRRERSRAAGIVGIPVTDPALRRANLLENIVRLEREQFLSKYHYYQ
jgi:hypothetical protein